MKVLALGIVCLTVILIALLARDTCVIYLQATMPRTTPHHIIP